MKNKLCALLLAFGMTASLALPLYAFDMREALKSADALNAYGLFNGTGKDIYGNPIYNLSRGTTRQEAITMLVRLLGKEEEALAGTWEIPFTDVDEWAKPYVGYAYENGLTGGISATAFGGTDTVTAAQYLTFLLRALGYSSETDFKWDEPYTLARSLGLFQRSEYGAGTNADFKRGDAAILSYNALEIKNKLTGERIIDGVYSRLLASDESTVKLDALVSDVCDKRAITISSVNNHESIKKYVVNDTADAALVSEAEIKALRTNRNTRTVSYAEAVSDISLYFRSFKSGYGAYYYFGDAFFKTIEANVLSELKGKESVTASELDSLLRKHMSAVQDGHLRRGDVDEYEYLYCEDQHFYLDSRGYYKLIDGKKWYYSGCDSEYVSMKPTLTATGALVYSLAWSSNGSNIVKCNKITLKSGAEISEEVVEWKQARAYQKSDAIDYKFLKQNGIAYISVRSFDNANGYSNYSEFVNSGSKVKDCKVIIMDLRANGGGTTAHPSNWLKNYTGSQTAVYQMTTVVRSTAVGARAEYGKDTSWSGSNSVRMHKNDSLVIILVDDKCASAGEFAMQMFKTLDNSIVIGSPSAGRTFCCGSLPSFCLPNSGVKYTYGTTMYWLDGEVNRDDMGIEPDIWCDPADSLDAVLMLLMRERRAGLDTVLTLKNGLK